MGPTVVEEGEFAGWMMWPQDPFEHAAGPFYFRKDEQGPVCAFRAEERHMNGLGSLHGGCFMSFADFALFGIATDELHGSEEGGAAVTVAFNAEFLAGAKPGDWIEARGEVLKAGRSILFVRGIITANGTPCLNFSGTLKRVRR
ncbi:MAG: thioesterase [Flavobacteriaceae bacterium]|nr:thioesterase [Flavobacteriaceae bacterium]